MILQQKNTSKLKRVFFRKVFINGGGRIQFDGALVLTLRNPLFAFKNCFQICVCIQDRNALQKPWFNGAIDSHSNLQARVQISPKKKKVSLTLMNLPISLPETRKTAVLPGANCPGFDKMGYVGVSPLSPCILIKTLEFVPAPFRLPVTNVILRNKFALD